MSAAPQRSDGAVTVRASDNLATLRRPPPMPAVERIQHAVACISDNTPLPPRELVEAALGEITAALGRSPPRLVEISVATMLSGWPSLKPSPLYIAALMSDLEGYPPDVVAEATNAIRRGARGLFPPSHAEILAEVSDHMGRRREIERNIRRALAEIGRREQAQRDRAERENAERDRIAEIERCLAKIGAGAPMSGLFALADRTMRFDRPILDVRRRFELADQWRVALLLRQEPWAVTTLRLAALVRKTLVNPIGDCARLAVLEMALLGDEARAETLLHAAIAAPMTDDASTREAFQSRDAKLSPAAADLVYRLLDRERIEPGPAEPG